MTARILTDAEVDALEELAEKATPGPWTVGKSHESVVAPNPADDDEARWYGGALIAESLFRVGDKELIAASREAIPNLVATIKALKSERDAARHHHLNLRKWITRTFGTGVYDAMTDGDFLGEESPR